MRTNTVLTILAIALAALFLPSAGAKAQPNVPILEVDTLVYLGKGVSGEAQGALFLPDGNIIAVWKGRPIIIDSKNGEIIRRLDSIPANPAYNENPKITGDGKYLCVNSIPGLALYDIESGKVVKYLPGIIDYCISSDGLKLYATIKNNANDPGIIEEYDMVTLERTDRFIKKDFSTGAKIAISPDGQTLVLSVFRKKMNDYDKKTNQVILIDLNNTSKYTVLEELEPEVKSMEFSPDGKQIAFMYNGGNYNNYIYIYSTENKVKKIITLQDLSTLFSIKFLGIGSPLLVDNSTILFAVGNDKKEQTYLLTWNIFEDRIKKFLNYHSIRSLDSRDSTIILCNQNGVIGFINKNVLPVIDPKSLYENNLTYTNSQLEYNSKSSFVGESIIYNTTGKLVTNLGTQPFIVGKNIISVNQPLLKGVYILTIKNGTDQSSYKFLVE